MALYELPLEVSTSQTVGILYCIHIKSEWKHYLNTSRPRERLQPNLYFLSEKNGILKSHRN